MTEQAEPQAGPVVKVARDLTEIERLLLNVPREAIVKSSDRLMPGGLAMVALAHDADPGAWGDWIAAAELRHMEGPYSCPKPFHDACVIKGAEHIEEEDDQDSEDPLTTLRFWSEQWREDHGYPLEGRSPTILSETRFIRWALDYAWATEPRWVDFAQDVNRVRRRLEDMLRAGRRSERARVTCPECAVEEVDEDGELREKPGPRLVRVYGTVAAYDRWKCPRCKHTFDADSYARALAQQLRSEGAERYVPQADAIATLRDQGRPERTIRKWLGPPNREEQDRCRECGAAWSRQEHAVCPAQVKVNGKIEVCGGELHLDWKGDSADAIVAGYCELRTHRTLLWWPDLWSRHQATRVRQRSA